MVDQLLLNKCKTGKRGGHRRGCEYLSQFDEMMIDGLRFRFLLYVHSKFLTIHVRTFVQSESHYVWSSF